MQRAQSITIILYTNKESLSIKNGFKYYLLSNDKGRAEALPKSLILFYDTIVTFEIEEVFADALTLILL